eukprot:923016-Alexandrium_andersonii.AAC.1
MRLGGPLLALGNALRVADLLGVLVLLRPRVGSQHPRRRLGLGHLGLGLREPRPVADPAGLQGLVPVP